MSLLPVPSAIASASSHRAVHRVRGVGDANSSDTLDGERGDDTAPRKRAAADRRMPAPSRIGTISFDPLWNGPCLRPAFVAQVLGQVMMDAREEASRLAPSAYRGRAAQVAPALLFDCEI